MSNIAIKIENVSKQYRLGMVGTGTLSHDLKRWWTVNLRGKEDPYLKIGEVNDRASKGNSDYIWALKDINLDIEQGDVVGIIGKNGAGKSTLLKLLSRVTKPTTGSIKYNGRIASLLEVGTGFHPEMTGRENIYMNGSIMGMTRSEISRKLDEIIAFAGVERYIDTPTKRYSSGMTVRLGFSIAAHLEPDILIVDEVLAVGDAEFQRKAIGKMQDVSKGGGRTVLFVSHNMAAVKRLCQNGIVLKNGYVAYKGTQENAISFYQNEHCSDSSYVYEESLGNEIGNENIQILKFDSKPLSGDVIQISSGFSFEVTFLNFKSGINLDITFELKTTDDITVFHHGTFVSTEKDSKVGVYTVKGDIKPNLINAGTYKFNIIFGENQRTILFKIDDFIQMEILNESIGSNSSNLPGFLRPDITYKTEFISAEDMKL